MSSRRDAGGRPYTSRSLSAAVEALPGDHASVSHASVNKLANGSQDNPTAHTVVAVCKALGVPPAYLLPHHAYSDLEALQTFEDPRARHVLALLSGLSHSALDDVVAELERRRAEQGLEPVQRRDDATEEAPPSQEEPTEAPGRGRRRRSSREAAEYAADSLEGL
ncbi:XRE family transcriptional regulator [Streptomyces nodosus]|uniref:XRE family transcriptional regulator n=2 Tax=Streptomyces nodosus TaxID=40318 RepID=A0A0B5DUQ8_9ACTN|nr:hypothetical protein SNOD_30880 [Streptomyces nodosus]QEV43608.1 XRE family transcriptional regulator [Streptomyces nodosus]